MELARKKIGKERKRNRRKYIRETECRKKGHGVKKKKENRRGERETDER